MTTFKIGQTVARLNPDKHETTHQIKTPEEVKYHTELAERGYKYTIIDGNDDFDLPEVKDGLRIHRKPFEECESCSA